MKTNDAINLIMEAHDVTRATMARRVGASRGTVGNQLNGRNEMSVPKVLKYLSELNYEMAFVPKDSPLPKGSYRIDGE